ncbi:MAG: hypothetical protein COX07_01610 [Bacteroidetes bacterium CG23_combo_of_CG06-09_8_20_14_all_32_9]|nr:MAG: hypothetical protein COX07_01610 [Bacteroidetes bacterium CG23_combo_of_CG06-09_8_20_14_all_32_9]
MKRLLLIIILLIVYCLPQAQTLNQINRQLDSLNNLQKNLQIKIKDLQDQLHASKEKIKALEAKKSSLSASASNFLDEDDFIVAKVKPGGAILRDAPTSTGKTLVSIPGNQTISVFKSQQNLYFKISYKGQIGYLSYSTIEQNQEIDDFLAGKEPVKEPVTTTVVRTVNKNDPRFQKLVKLYGSDNAIKIINSELWQGMSYGMVLESIGKPNSKNSTNTSDGIKEQWIYSDYKLDFLNGELKNWTKK